MEDCLESEKQQLWELDGKREGLTDGERGGVREEGRMGRYEMRREERRRKDKRLGRVICQRARRSCVMGTPWVSILNCWTVSGLKNAERASSAVCDMREEEEELKRSG